MSEAKYKPVECPACGKPTKPNAQGDLPHSCSGECDFAFDNAAIAATKKQWRDKMCFHIQMADIARRAMERK